MISASQPVSWPERITGFRSKVVNDIIDALDSLRPIASPSIKHEWRSDGVVSHMMKRAADGGLSPSALRWAFSRTNTTQMTVGDGAITRNGIRLAHTSHHVDYTFSTNGTYYLYIQLHATTGKDAALVPDRLENTGTAAHDILVAGAMPSDADNIVIVLGKVVVSGNVITDYEQWVFSDLPDDWVRWPDGKSDGHQAFRTLQQNGTYNQLLELYGVEGASTQMVPYIVSGTPSDLTWGYIVTPESLATPTSYNAITEVNFDTSLGDPEGDGVMKFTVQTWTVQDGRLAFGSTSEISMTIDGVAGASMEAWLGDWIENEADHDTLLNVSTSTAHTNYMANSGVSAQDSYDGQNFCASIGNSSKNGDHVIKFDDGEVDGGWTFTNGSITMTAGDITVTSGVVKVDKLESAGGELGLDLNLKYLYAAETGSDYSIAFGDRTLKAKSGSGGEWDVSSDNYFAVLNTDDSTSSSTGALRVSGGCYLAKDLFTGGNVKIPTGKGYYVNGVQVVTDRQAHIANISETGAAEDSVARAAINDILELLEAHGLMATS